MSAVPFEAIERPRFRAGVTVRYDSDAIVLDYRDDGCRIEVSPDRADSMSRLLDALSAGGRSFAELATSIPELDQDLEEILDDLDRLGLLQETGVAPSMQAVTGEQMYHDVIRLADRALAENEGGLVDLMRRSVCTTRHLIGYAIEYYHVVSMAPQIVAPALAKTEPRRVHKALQAFYASELNHDRMLENALSAVGISQETLDSTIPLPETFALCSALAAYALQHPLSFKASLFLFEEANPEFNELFARECKRLGLPREFTKPILDHATINDKYDHGNISLDLLREVECVTEEERLVVLKHVQIMVETLLKQDRRLGNYYGDVSNPSPRIFN